MILKFGKRVVLAAASVIVVATGVLALMRLSQGETQAIPYSTSDQIRAARPLGAQEALIMGLRLIEGVDLARIARLSGLSVETLVDERAVARLDRQGLVTLNGGQLRVTDAGALLLDGILSEIVTA